MSAVPATPAAPASGTNGQPTRGLTRWVRVALLGGVSLGLATTAHLAAGGRSPSAGVLLVTGLLLGLTAVTLTARRCRFGVLVAVLTVQQILLHLLFEATATVSTGCGLMTTSGMDHALHAAVQACDPARSAMGPMPGWGMWAAHLGATALTAGLLARGEAWFWRVAEQIVRAATARPGGWPTGRIAPVVGVRPGAAYGWLGHRDAAPRAPPVLRHLT